MTAEELIVLFSSNLISESITLDNLDEAWLQFNDKGEVVVMNEHGTEFPVSDLSQVEIDIFENILT